MVLERRWWIGLAFAACAESTPSPTPTAPEAPPPPAPPPQADAEPLRAVWASSGPNARFAFDGDPSTAWTPAGDPAGESVVAEFETAASWTHAHIHACAGATPFTVEVEVDGVRVGTADVGAVTPGSTVPTGGGARGRSLTLRVRGPVRTACIAEVRLERGPARLPLTLPRTVRGGVTATSTRKPFPEANPAAYALDGRLDTPWVEGVATQGAGEILEVTVNDPQAVSAVELWNGDGRSADALLARGAVRRLRLSVDGGAWTDLAYEPTPAPQTAALQVPLRGRSFRLQIDDVAGGPTVKETAVSEVRFHDGAGPWTLTGDDVDRHTRVVRVDLANAPLTSLLDRQLGAACPPEGASFTLRFRGDATLSAVQRSGPVDDRLDGTWAIDGARGPWSRVDVWQRTHRVLAAEATAPEPPSWAPFAARVEVARAADLDAAGVDEFLTGLPEADRACLPTRFPGGSVAGELQKLEAVLVRGPLLAGAWIPVPPSP